MKRELENAVRQIIDLLVSGEHYDLEALTEGRRLTAAQIGSAIQEYGRTLITPPPDQLAIDAIQVTGKKPATWSVSVPLWTREESRSDLTLELTIEDRVDGPRVDIDNIHVL